MITLLALAALSFLTGVAMGRTERETEEACEPFSALAYTLPPPPVAPTFAEQLFSGKATIRGECSWCSGPWSPCALGCVRRPAPIEMPIPGPGYPRRG